MHCRLIELLIRLLLECPPYRIVFGKPCHLPLELKCKAMWAIKKLNCDFQVTKDRRLLKMNELEELRNEAYDNAKSIRTRLKDGMIREF